MAKLRTVWYMAGGRSVGLRQYLNKKGYISSNAQLFLLFHEYNL